MRSRLLVAALVAAALLLDEAGSTQAASLALVAGVPASAIAALLALGRTLDSESARDWLRTVLATTVTALVFAAASAPPGDGALLVCLGLLAFDGLLRGLGLVRPRLQLEPE